MAAFIQGILLLAVFCIPIVTLLHSSRDDLRAVLIALEKLVAYYERNHKYLNLDGLFGLRVIEGQLQLLISEHQAGSHQHLSEEVMNKIIYLRSAAHNASNVGLESVRNDDTEYFKDFSSLVSSPWTVMKSHRKLETSLRWEIPQYKAKVKVKLTEEMSDRCMTELIKNGSSGCEISDACFQIMTTRGLTGYGITHQVLWSILAEIMANCSVSLNKVLSQHNMGNINTFQLELCTNNFYEMVAVVQVLMHGKVHESHQDLFLEQQFVCPNLGFYEFMKKDYLHQILSWQFPSGCFGEREVSQTEEEDVDLASLLEGYHDSNSRFVPDINKKDHADIGIKKMKVNEVNENFSHVDRSSQVTNSNPVARFSHALPQSLNAHHVSTGDVVLRVPRHVVLTKTSTSKWQHQASSKLTDHNGYSSNQEINFRSSQVKKMNSQILSGYHNSNIYDTEMTRETLHTTHQALNMLDKSSNTVGFVSKSISFQNGYQLPNNKDSAEHSPKKQNQVPVTSSQLTLANTKDNMIPDNVLEDKTASIGRKLLVEKEMEGGCLSHKTGVGSGALVMYLRYLIQPDNISWTGQHELFLSDSRNLLQATVEGPVVGAGEDVAHAGEEGEEEEEEEEEENMVQKDGLLNDAVNYNEGNDAEAGEDQGGDDYNEEEAEKGGRVIRVGADRDSDTVIINEDAEKDSEIYADNNKVVPDIPNKTAFDADDVVQEEDHNYYDDEGETERGIIKRRKPPTSRPHPPVKTRRKHSESFVSQEPVYGQGPESLVPDHPNYTIILFVSVAPFFILFFFLFKFIRKRRVHIRYYF